MTFSKISNRQYNILYIYIYIFEIIKTVKKLKIFQELSSIEKNKKTNIQN